MTAATAPSPALLAKMTAQTTDATSREPSSAPPSIRYTMADQVKKGEDMYCANANCRHGSTTFGVYGVCHGPPAFAVRTALGPAGCRRH